MNITRALICSRNSHFHSLITLFCIYLIKCGVAEHFLAADPAVVIVGPSKP